MRIGIDARMYGSFSTGIGMYTKHLIDELEKIDSENEYFIFLNDLSFSEYTPKNPRFIKILAPYSQDSIIDQFLFTKMLYKTKLDLMHFTHWSAPLWYRKKSVISLQNLVHSFYPWREWNSSLGRWRYSTLLSSIMRRSKYVIVPGKRVKKDLVELFGTKEEAIEIIPPGIPVDTSDLSFSETEVRQMKESLGIRQKEYFLHLGSIEERKNIVRFLEAFSKIVNEYPDIGLVLAGKENPEYHAVRDALVQLWLQEKVRITGFVDDAQKAILLRSAKALVFPSLYEGFPLPAFEALAAKIPILCSQAPGIYENIWEKNALFFAPLNQEAITQVLRDFCSENSGSPKNPKISRQIQDGLVHAKSFSMEESAKKTLAIYMRALGKSDI